MKLRPSRVYVACILASLAATSPASAQRVDPPAPAGPGTIVGIVTDAASRPIEDAEVRIGALKRVMRTGRNGGFRFDSVPAGKHDVRVRHVGFEAQSRTVTVREQGGTIAFVLKAIPQKLPTVVTTVSRGGLSGIVTDEKSRALPGAEVRMFGTHARTVTDSAGEFFMDVRPGSYMVRVTSRGHESRLVSVVIPSDSGRRIAVAVRAGRSGSNREAIEMENLARRLVWRTSPSAFFTRERLQDLGEDGITTLVASVSANPLPEEGCLVVVNGGPDSLPLWYFDADELEGVEVYPAGSLSYTTGAKRQKSIVSGRDSRGGAARSCPQIFVWLR